MIFSVFNDNARCWEYFEAPGTSATYGARGTKYRPLHGRPSGPPATLSGGAPSIGPIGFTPEALAIPLPSNARRIGHGSEARGVVAVQATSLARLEPQRVYAHPVGVSGLGAVDEGGKPVVVEGIPLSKVILAACVASVVGVIVQKMLK